MNLPRSGRDTGPVLHDGFYKLAATVTRRSLKPKVTCQPTTDGSGTATIWAFCHLRQILFKVVLAICSIFLGVGTSLYISIWSCPKSFRKSHPQKKSVVIEETYIMLMTTQGYFTLATCRISYQYCTIQSSTPPLGEFQSATSRPEPSLRQKAGAQSHGNLNESTPSAFLFFTIRPEKPLLEGYSSVSPINICPANLCFIMQVGRLLLELGWEG